MVLETDSTKYWAAQYVRMSTEHQQPVALPTRSPRHGDAKV